jgi:hypothetical protein
MNRNVARSYGRTLAGGSYVIDFPVGQGFGELQTSVMACGHRHSVA